ncbi:hypothetical protein [Streptomyces sp. enrichment culture]|uniref:hypothetical protein n=1 Tax=Streptomyces sp. enrichment culture TaxID=1795815 RepID=UPI003F54CFFB
MRRRPDPMAASVWTAGVPAPGTRIGSHLLDMYGPVKVYDCRTANGTSGEGSLRASEPCHEEAAGEWRITVPRREAVGVRRIVSATVPGGR